MDLSNAEKEERGKRILLRHLHRVRDHSNYVGDCDSEEQEIGGDEEQKGNEQQELGELLKLQDERESWKEFIGDMSSSRLH